MLELEDMKPKNLNRGSGGIKTLILPFSFLHLLETLNDSTAHALYFTNSCNITLIAEESQC